jgi:hypothetical protein
MSKDYSPATEIVGRHLDGDPIPLQDADAEAPHVAAEGGKHGVPVREEHPECRVRKYFRNLPFELNRLFLGHVPSVRVSAGRCGSALALRAPLSPPGSGSLELSGFARLHVVPLLSKVLENAGLGDATLENLERPIQSIAFFNFDFDHLQNLPDEQSGTGTARSEKRQGPPDEIRTAP